MLKKENSALAKKVLLVLAIVIIVGLLTLFTWPLLHIIIGDIYGFFRSAIKNEHLWNSLGILVLLFASIIFLFWVALPFIVYTVKTLSAYFSLYNICLFSKHKIKINGIPFLPSKRSEADGDITIETEDGILCLHFINMIFKYRRAITIPNSQEYVITPLVPNRISKQGQGIGGVNMSSGNGHRNALIRSTQYALSRNHDKIKHLPKIRSNDEKKHVLLIPNMPAEAKCVIKNISVPLSNGQTIGSFTFYSLGYLKKGLKNQLHTSLFQ